MAERAGDDDTRRGARIRQARKHAGVPQKALAERLAAMFNEPIDQSYISRWENKGERPSDSTIRAIGELLGVSAGWLTHGDVPGVEVPTWARPAPPLHAFTVEQARAREEAVGRAADEAKKKGGKKRGA